MTDIRSLIDLVESSGGVPDVLYHGTFAHHVPSIKQHGLGGKIAQKNFDVSGRGVYLTDDPDAADQWASDTQFGTQGDVVVLAVDVASLDSALLVRDPNDEGERGGTSYIYRGVIPATSITGLDGSIMVESDSVPNTGLNRRYSDRHQETMGEWLGRRGVEREGDRFVFYHATPKRGGATLYLRAGSLLETDPDSAVHFCGRDRGLKRSQINLHRLVLGPDDIEPGMFARLVKDTPISKSTLVPAPKVPVNP